MKARPDSVRRTRDLLRAAVLRGDFVDGILPGERELVGSYSVSRGIVREVLTLLRDEGLIARTQGVGHTSSPLPRTGDSRTFKTLQNRRATVSSMEDCF
ncbi:GntR family transcriptional regulator [Rhodococcus globerulus]|uniref:GntR family transcriptional regulator n=1 Tax=Rhodococcus globerulus TaxID=33008 RepID=UPI000E300C6D